MTTSSVLLDTDTLSEILKERDSTIQRQAQEYLALHQRFQFSIMTRYEILRGLQAKDASRKILEFEYFCAHSTVLPLTDEVVVQAAKVYGFLRKRGTPIGDGDILIAATALVQDLVLVTNNLNHFQRIPGLRFETWRVSPSPS
jgi:tRNA(fMet)-specific endonuclease VapC